MSMCDKMQTASQIISGPSFSGAVHTFGPTENGTIKSEPDVGNVALEAEVLHGSDAIPVDASSEAARLDFRCILR
jgi:hypothetical protein